MSVPKHKRKPSPFQVYENLTKMRKETTNCLLRNFGYDYEKAMKRLERDFGKSYGELTPEQRRSWDVRKEKYDSMDCWFASEQRKTILDILRKITAEVHLANNIYPTVQAEVDERRIHQDRAIGYCFILLQELQYTFESLPSKIQVYLNMSALVNEEIKCLKGWRKSTTSADKKRISKEKAENIEPIFDGEQIKIIAVVYQILKDLDLQKQSKKDKA